MPKKQDKYLVEFVDQVNRQVAHLTIKRNYVAYKVDKMVADKSETTEEIGKIKLELGAINKQLVELESLQTWLSRK